MFIITMHLDMSIRLLNMIIIVYILRSQSNNLHMLHSEYISSLIGSLYSNGSNMSSIQGE